MYHRPVDQPNLDRSLEAMPSQAQEQAGGSSVRPRVSACVCVSWLHLARVCARCSAVGTVLAVVALVAAAGACLCPFSL